MGRHSKRTKSTGTHLRSIPESALEKEKEAVKSQGKEEEDSEG